MTAPVAIDRRAASAWPVLQGVRCAFPDDVIVGLGGEVLRVLEDGSAEPVLPGGHPHPSASADPCAGRRRAA